MAFGRHFNRLGVWTTVVTSRFWECASELSSALNQSTDENFNPNNFCTWSPNKAFLGGLKSSLTCSQEYFTKKNLILLISNQNSAQSFMREQLSLGVILTDCFRRKTVELFFGTKQVELDQLNGGRRPSTY